MKLLLPFIFICSFVFVIKGQQNYHRARIYYQSAKDLVLLANQGVSIDHATHKKGVFIASDFSENELNIARRLGLKYEITIPNVTEYYKNQNSIKNDLKNASCLKATNFSTPANYNNGSMGGFLTYDEMLQELDDMATLYPNIISIKDTIGNFATAESRPIYWVKISDNPTMNEAEPEMLYTAIHHAREPGSLQQTIFYMWYLLENYATNDEVKAIINNTELYFIPCINPDGYVYNEAISPNGGGLWRKNRRNNLDGEFGVDLNRNYSYQWGGAGTSANTNSDIYKGTAPFSEPETQAIKWFCEQHEFRIALNSHTQGGLLLYPFGYATGQQSADDATYNAISEVMVEQNGYINQISAALYAAAGDSDDWMYAETSTHNKILAMTPEIGRSFWPNQNDIIPMCKEMVYHNLTAANAITNFAKTKDKETFSISDNSGFFNYEIKRIGLNNPGNFSVRIEPISSNIVSVGSQNTHLGMSLLQTEIDSISYQLSSFIQDGDEIKYVLITNNTLYDKRDTITKVYGSLQSAFSDNGSNTSNWNSNGNWGTTTLFSYSPSSSITDSPNGNYTNSSTSIIQLANETSLTNSLVATASFYARWDIEAGWDYLQFEISTDNGNSWIPQCGKYTKTGNENQAQGEPLYDGLQNSWVKEEIDLSDYIGQSIKARFKLVTDQAVNEDGFYFDDFKINVSYGTNNILEQRDDYNLGQSYPNPANKTATIAYNIQNNSTNNFRLINQVGELVYSKSLTNKKGELTLNTAELSSGVYYYYISNGKQKSNTYKLLVHH